MCVTSPFLTVVVPAYNVEKYLEECLNSLLNQTLMEHKIVVVNDGSKDATGEIGKRYAEKYPDKILYVEQENQGLGAARNTGMSMVDTPYITFLDSDDWWDCFFVEKVKREIERQEQLIDIIFTLPWIFDSATSQLQEWHDKGLMEKLFYPNDGDENEASEVINIESDRGLELYSLEASACRRIYRMAFLREIDFKFPVGVKWEDVKPHFHAVHNAKSCVGVKSTGFLYRINTGNQITSGGGASRLDIIPVFNDTLQMAIKEKWNDQEIAYIIRMLWSFSLWSIEETNLDYISQLLRKLHAFFLTIPKKYFKIYFELCSPHRLREQILTFVICSPFYGILKDYRMRQAGLKCLLKIYHIKNKLWRR